MSIDLSVLSYAAGRGEQDAALFLGIFCFIKKNYIESFRWLEYASDNNSMLAQYLLSNMYKEGYGTQKNHLKAFSYATESAKQGFTPAKIMLSQYYEEGIGVDMNSEKSNKILIEMAELGNAQAALHLGIKFQDSDNNFSIEKSIKWLTLANEIDNSATTSFLLATAYEKSNNNKNALKYYINACELGSSDACVVLAIVYSKGLLDVEISQSEAKRYSLKGIEPNSK